MWPFGSISQPAFSVLGVSTGFEAGREWRTIQLQAAARRLAGSGADLRGKGAAWALAARDRTKTRRVVLRRTARFMGGLTFRRPAAAVSLIAVEPPGKEWHRQRWGVEGV